MHKKGDRGRPEDAWSLDDVVYKTEVKNADQFQNIKDVSTSGGVYIHGLFLEGCKW